MGGRVRTRRWLWRSGVVVLAAVLVAPLFGFSSATAMKAHGARNLVLSGAWTTSADVAWVWTQSTSGATGSEQAVLRSADGGGSWTNVTPPGLGVVRGNAYLGGVDVLDNSDAWIVHGDVSGLVEKLEFTSNGGRTWSTVGTIPKGGCEIQFVSRASGWCTVYGGAAGSMLVKLFHTSDGGREWTLISKNEVNSDPKGTLPFGCDKQLYFDSALIGWADFYCNGGVAPIYETLDGGTTWVQRLNAAPKGVIDGGSDFQGAPVTSGSHVAVSFTAFSPTRSLVYVSNDDGRTFAPVSVPVRGRQVLQDLLTASSWKVFWGHTIDETTNAGQTWHSVVSNVDITSLYSPQSGLPTAVDFLNAKVGWLTSSTLWRTVDGGATWTRLRIPTLAS